MDEVEWRENRQTISELYRVAKLLSPHCFHRAESHSIDLINEEWRAAANTEYNMYSIVPCALLHIYYTIVINVSFV